MEDKSILVVEDNPDDVELTLRAVRKSGIKCRVSTAQDGVEAARMLGLGSSPGEQPDSLQPSLILLDLKLPRLDGFQLLRQLRADPQTRLLPVVILSSSREQEDVMDSYTLGANSFVQKPVDFREFVETLRFLDAYWLELNEPPPVQQNR